MDGDIGVLWVRRLFGWGYWSVMDEEVVWMGILECYGGGGCLDGDIGVLWVRRLFGWGYWSVMSEEVVWMGILECYE